MTTPTKVPDAIAEEAQNDNFTLAAFLSPKISNLPNIIPPDSEESEF
jgi:hypothetical protein